MLHIYPDMTRSSNGHELQPLSSHKALYQHHVIVKHPILLLRTVTHLSTAMTRDKHALAILGPTLHSRLPNLNVLIVGSGGIGCELRAWLLQYPLVLLPYI